MNPSRLVTAVLATTTLAAQAHPGHGVPGASHWHASDTIGWLAVAVVAAVALVWGRRK